MRENVGRGAQVRVPEQFLDEFQISGFLVDDSCGGMPERVESRTSAVSPNTKAIQGRVEHVSP